jgi:hypothetical protein
VIHRSSSWIYLSVFFWCWLERASPYLPYSERPSLNPSC